VLCSSVATIRVAGDVADLTRWQSSPLHEPNGVGPHHARFCVRPEPCRAEPSEPLADRVPRRVRHGPHSVIQLPIPFASNCDSTLPRYIWALDRRTPRGRSRSCASPPARGPRASPRPRRPIASSSRSNSSQVAVTARASSGEPLEVGKVLVVVLVRLGGDLLDRLGVDVREGLPPGAD
jgi:hypothetical protein